MERELAGFLDRITNHKKKSSVGKKSLSFSGAEVGVRRWRFHLQSDSGSKDVLGSPSAITDKHFFVGSASDVELSVKGVEDHPRFATCWPLIFASIHDEVSHTWFVVPALGMNCIAANLDELRLFTCGHSMMVFDFPVHGHGSDYEN